MDFIIGKFSKLKNSINHLDEQVLGVKNFYGLWNQLLFILAVDSINGNFSAKRSIYTLLFYNVFAYCISYIQDQMKGQKYIITVADSSEIRHLAMTTTKIVLEWTKAITFLITVLFIILVYGFREGIHDFSPSAIHVTLTFIYYTLTERIFVDLLLKLSSRIQLEEFEGMEELMFHIVRNSVLLIMSSIVALLLLVYKVYNMAPIFFYVNVHLRVKQLRKQGLEPIRKHNKILWPFRIASHAELKDNDDVCSVCLQPMRRARITPCHHFFHSSCLRRCLQISDTCPLCKQSFDVSS